MEFQWKKDQGLKEKKAGEQLKDVELIWRE